jgi:arsenate reductase (thioredoxin)
MKKILVLCTGNSCRSQMAEAWLKHYSSNFEVYSAGVEAHGINPYMKKVMEEAGLNIDSHTSNLMEEYQDISFDYVVTVCDNAKSNCPYFKNATITIHQSFLDPADAEGTDTQKTVVYAKVRDEIEVFCKDFLLKIS